MTDKIEDGSSKPEAQAAPVEPQNPAAEARRRLLKRLGRFAGVTAPTVTLLLAAATKPNKAQAVSLISSKSLKSAAGEVDAANVLASVAALPVETWRYKLEAGPEQQTHIGPYAEDFQKAFGVGDGVTISTIDAVGVCLAAIKALSEKVGTLDAELQLARQEKAA
jgi:hypothetical protein